MPFVDAAKWILTGFFFKLYVANNLNEMTSYMSFPLYETLQTQDRWLLVFLYSYQIYADFFGYSAIAIGLALLFGYRLPVNFNLPYISTSFSEFWTRWHISLSSWLRTYLYVPLGGNRHGRCQNLPEFDDRDGARRSLARRRPELSDVGTVARRAAGHRAAAAGATCSRSIRRRFCAARMGFVFLCVTMLWIFFKLPNFDHAVGYLTGMFTPSTNPNPPKLFYDLALLYSLPVMIQHLASRALFERRLRGAEPYLYGAMAALMYLEAGPETSFIYFQF